MSTLAESLKSSSSRPIRLRKRADLSVRQHSYQGHRYWIVKEPVGLKYFRFQEEEYAILEMLDGQASLDEIRLRFEQAHAPQRITAGELQQFIGSLHRNGLTVAMSPGQGRELKKQHDERRHKQRMAALTNVLTIRFRGIDPDRFLTRAYPCVAWLFSPMAVLIVLLMGLAAMSLIAVQFETFRTRLPAFHEFFGPQEWLLLAAVLAVTKIFHELGHGFACKHFGGECHNLGLMLLVLTPCFYCDVSDSWLLPSKWKRAAIAAAGIYIEVTLASLATFVWWFSEPGMLHYLSLRVMFICSVSTIVVNANPLMRYDGYYVLSDLMEIPNLRQKSSSILNRWLASFCLGFELPEDPFLPKRNRVFFILFSIASVIYRWVLVISITTFLCKLLEPYNLEVLGQSFAAFSIGGMLVKPIVQFVKFMRIPGRSDQMKRKNALCTCIVVATVVVLVMTVPLPRRVHCTFELQPREATSVYVDVPGRVEEILVQPGEHVEAGTPLIRMVNNDLELEIEELNGQRNEYQASLRSLKHGRFVNQQSADEIRQVEESLASIEQQLQERNQELTRMVVKAPCTGTILPGQWQQASPQTDGRLRGWSGSLLSNVNSRASVTESTMLCEIGDPQRFEAVLVIDQSDVELVSKDQQASLKLAAFAGTTYGGKVMEIGKGELQAAPGNLASGAGGELATRTDSSGVQRPLSTCFSARVPLDDPGGLLQIGLRGHASIHTGWQTLGQRLWRYLSHTFHFSL